MSYEVGFATHQGRVRSSNQDSIGVFEPRSGLFQKPGLPLFVVADGMGGYQGGEIASQIAVTRAAEEFNRHPQTAPGEALRQAVQAANLTVIEEAADMPPQIRMGTTIVAASADEDRFYVANVGDSRAYLIDDEEISRITEDHSLVADHVRAGHLTEEEAFTAEGRNIITRSLGRDENLEVDVFEGRWRSGDVLVLCTDGLWGVMSDAQLMTIAAELPPQQAADRLIEAAMMGQSTDNISVVVVKHT